MVITERHVKRLSTILLVIPLVLILDKVLAQSQGESLFTGNIGIAPYTFRNSFPQGIAATLDTIQMLGFTEIEGGGGNMDAHEYKKLCEERGLKIPSMGASYQQIIENPEQVIERARIYEARYVMCSWIPHTTGKFDIQDARKAVKDFNRVGKLFKQHGLTLCYHPHGYEFKPYKNGTLLDYIITQTNANHVSFEMDIFWIQFGGGDPAELLRKYPSRWKLMHLKDMKEGIPKDLTGLTNPEYDVALGTGQIDIKRVIQAAQEIGVEHYFIEDESSRILEQIPQSIRYLENLTAQ